MDHSETRSKKNLSTTQLEWYRLISCVEFALSRTIYSAEENNVDKTHLLFQMSSIVYLVDVISKFW